MLCIDYQTRLALSLGIPVYVSVMAAALGARIGFSSKLAVYKEKKKFKIESTFPLPLPHMIINVGRKRWRFFFISRRREIITIDSHIV